MPPPSDATTRINPALPATAEDLQRLLDAERLHFCLSVGEAKDSEKRWREQCVSARAEIDALHRSLASSWSLVEAISLMLAASLLSVALALLAIGWKP